VKLFLSTLHFRHLHFPGQVFCHFWVSIGYWVSISGYVCEQGEAAIVETHDNTDLFRKLYQDGALDKHKMSSIFLMKELSSLLTLLEEVV
jgi:hypothetical protein